MAFYDEGEGIEKKIALSHLVGHSEHLDYWYAEHGPCFGVLLAFFGAYGDKPTPELEFELIQPHMAQKPVLRGEVGCACVAREVGVERGAMGFTPTPTHPSALHIRARPYLLSRH